MARKPKPKPMESAVTALGTEALAALVLDEIGRNAAFKAIVAAAIAARAGPAAVEAFVDRELSKVESGSAMIDPGRQRAFETRLSTTLAAIVKDLAPADAGAAAAALVRFIGCADTVLDRLFEGSVTLEDAFEAAIVALQSLVEAMPEPDRAAVLTALAVRLPMDHAGLIEAAFRDLVRLVPPPDLARVDTLLAAAETEPPRAANEGTFDPRRNRLLAARQAIAIRRGDIEAYMALEARKPHPDALAVAEQLLAAGRHGEALYWVRRPSRRGLRIMHQADLADGGAGEDVIDVARVGLEVRILIAMGDLRAAQALRWRRYEATLDADILRDYLAALPDFEEFAALDRAFAHAAGHSRRYRALEFLIDWPRLDLAARLVLDRASEWDGRHHETLAPAADVLEQQSPEAATILYRVLIDDILNCGRSSAYGHAARHLARLGEIGGTAAARGGTGPDHHAYRQALELKHGRKYAFWAAVARQPR